MLDAYKSIYERWLHTGKRYPHGERLDYVKKFKYTHSNSINSCGSKTAMNSRDSYTQKWPLFRKLLAPEETKTEKRKLLAKIVRDHEGSMDSIFEELKEIYLKSPSRNPIHSKHYALGTRMWNWTLLLPSKKREKP